MNTTGELVHCFYPDSRWVQVFTLDQTEFPRPWRMQDWIDLRGEHHQLYAWETAGQVLGFCLFGLVPGDAVAHLLKICVLSTQRSSGLTKIFWNSITSELSRLDVRQIYLEVEDTNARAIAFYQKVGFSQIRKVSKYYSDGADALIMQLTL